MKKIIVNLAVAAMACSGLNAMAATGTAAAPECEGIKIATGQAGKGYARLFTDIKKVCGGSVRMCEVPTTGGLDNLTAMSTNEADIGMAQIDTVADMKKGDENVAALQEVMAINFNYLHVVTAANGYTVAGDRKLMGLMKGDSSKVMISRFSDLKGKRVAVVGSAALLGRKLDRLLQYGMQFVDVNDDDAAFKLVKAGQVAAAFSLSGWPSGTVGKLTQDSGLSLVPFDASVNAPYVVRTVNYKGIGVYNSNTMAVQNVLLTRPFKGAKANDVAALKACVTGNLVDLQEGSYSPGWKEIKKINSDSDIPKFVSNGVQATKKK